MKKLIVTAIAVASAASVFAQGTIIFNDFVSTLKMHIYQPLSSNPGFSQVGNAATETPAGTTSWAGFSVIGATGVSGQYGGSTTFAALLAAPGQGQPESSLQGATSGGITTFKTGTAVLGGTIVATTPTFGNIQPDFSGGATVEIVAWDHSQTFSGYDLSIWGTATSKNAFQAWQDGLIAAGKSPVGNITLAVGGTATSPPNLPGSLASFNLYMVPEPGTFALAGLGMAVLLVFRRRK